MRRQAWLVPALLVLSACGGSDGSAATVPASTSFDAAGISVSGTEPSPATVAPTTVAPTTTTTLERSVAFATSGQQFTPIVYEDKRPSSLVIHSEATGDVEGALTSALVAVQNSSLALVWFEGRFSDCGSGALAIRIASKLDGTVGWEVVPGLGRGDLAKVTGGGEEVAPHFTGTILCDGKADPKVFSTTLLEPTPAGGTPAGLPPHIPTKTTNFDVTAHPGQTMMPKMWFNEVAYDKGVIILLFMWRSEDVDTPLRNTSASVWSMPDVCGHGGMSRSFIDDVEYPEFRGAWDLPATINEGAHGGGAFDSKLADGYIVCP